VAVDQNKLPVYTQDEIERLLNVEGVRIAYSVRELAHMLGVSARRLADLLEDKEVKTFWLSNRRMVGVDTVRGILAGTVDLSRAPERLRDDGGVIIGNAEPAAV
jgi:hypothetical protein